ncbi:uncharacterized protein BDW43DRAFT_158090 [Aspergillus alliaceus]|uniref:uncharacterized protein n=1 Tax=Petromyces alliaceus TaxID=209559 RepID=UPI0012A5A466|nr:uncharacterized protein BDW43DRAFT_158090 [Aspergillus alliaceus]KAB8230720.1 hypothetical protein BDW43DRAFT_158090 [Aspergillus alliaceus]
MCILPCCMIIEKYRLVMPSTTQSPVAARLVDLARSYWCIVRSVGLGLSTSLVLCLHAFSLAFYTKGSHAGRIHKTFSRNTVQLLQSTRWMSNLNERGIPDPLACIPLQRRTSNFLSKSLTMMLQIYI